MLTKPKTVNGFLSHDRGRLLAYTVLGAGALSLSLLAGWHGLHRQAEPSALPAVADQSTPAHGPMIVGLGPWARTAAANAPAAAPEQTASLEAEIRPSLPEEAAPEPGPDEASADAGADVPLPPRKPAELRTLAGRNAAPAPIRQAALPAEPGPAPTPADNRSFFEKIFGGAGAEPPQSAQTEPAPAAGRAGRRPQSQPTQALAYAPQESTGGLFGGLTNPAAPAAPTQTTIGATAQPSAGTAVYNIATHTVYMPDGSRLEAHSGLREYLDNPHYVHVRMRGPTPPSVYALTPREALFHGVEALRLTPIGGNSIFGRAGLLAHTFMLGPNGDSNGCVSFRDYNAFLQAFKRGDVRRLVVVAGM
ncbi:MAG: tlde1 domain-containing protein [Methylocystis sp.]|uniref:DUF2778 domain-containing protein n=1 Tax=Methylocystis sp. TaxID=1911079 RepID=UPI003DA21343